MKDLLETNLNMDVDEIEIERAHRTGKSKAGKPRQIVAKLLQYKDKEQILKNSKQLKGTGIFINEDFSSLVIKRRNEQQEEMVKARKEGKIAYFSVDRLIIKDRMVPSADISHGSFGSLGASGFFKK